MDSSFESLGLLPQFTHIIEQMGYEKPTPIQEAAMPALMGGRNVIGQAQTGTGKTAAFALPMLQHLEAGKGHVQALVLAPTRELANQVAEAIGQLAGSSSVRVLAVYGGQSYEVQIRQLKRGVDVVVGTPGRLLDLIRKEVLDLSQVRYLVLDEADEMLEMGFIDDVETILAQVPAGRQMSLFSATLPRAVRKLADRYLSDPFEITIHPERLTVAETEQRYCRVHEKDKLSALIRLLDVEEVKSALVFTRTKARAQELTDELNRRGVPAQSLHGDLNQSRREVVLGQFRQGTIALLVATDVAARGLDIEDVSHVFNYDAPGDVEDFVHRIGRTGRAGRKGIAISFFTANERGKQRAIEAFTHQTMKECAVPTREQIQSRRDERFIQRLGEELGKGDLSHERALISRLEATKIDPLEIAIAAIRLARANEMELPVDEIKVPKAEFDRGRPHDETHGKEAPRNSEKAGRTYDGKKGKKSSQPEAIQDFAPWRQRRHRHTAGMVTLIMNLGDAHGVRPGDVVGAIASEVGIPGKAIGEIEIHKEHTFVDISEKHVRQVLRESSGKYSLRGKLVQLSLAG